jgi:hypothetical protein
MPTIPYKNKAGKRVPGTTTVMASLGWSKEALMYWANEVGRLQGISHREVTTKEADAGSLCHAFMERDTLERLKLPLDKVQAEVDQLCEKLSEEQVAKAYKGFDNFLKWSGRMNLKPIIAEPNLVSEKMQVGGTPDYIGTCLDGRALVDYKTSKSTNLYPDNIIQVATYKSIWEELHPDQPIDLIIILKLDKLEGSFAHFEFEGDHPKIVAGLKVFRYLRGIHELKKVLK